MNPNNVTVRSTLPPGATDAKCLSILGAVCDTAAKCQEVQTSATAKPAYDALKDALTSAETSLEAKQNLLLALANAVKHLHEDMTNLRSATRTFEATVAALAKGNANLITKAGLATRALNPAPTALGKVSVVRSKPGPHACEALITWPKGPGATGYAIEVNFTPQNPAGPYTALISGTGRRRIVKGATPGCQFLVRIASLGSGGTQSDWSDPILATAL